ncbi:hypothetical protein [Sphingomicrobium nitratireducens]|uniref:PAS domain-containing protein n=1 Tax=Sphingomicrobium nitratireducens TaxID=2964666 RepID=UPI0022406EE6|nr:hypothetical protein [Sphingomicrobium nitratireducens]
MDSYSESQGYDADVADEVAPGADVADAIGTDERRMHVRAYNYWCSLLEGRDYPSIEDLEPGDIRDFGPHSVLLDFTAGIDNPATPYIGEAIREECGLESDIKRIGDVPPRSLLSRLTDHYMQIIANRAPVGFEAEFVNQRNHEICYRGIMMPFSSDGETIDFIYGVINWKDRGDEVAADTPIKAALPPLEDPVEAVPSPGFVAAGSHPQWEDGPLAEAAAEADPVAVAALADAITVGGLDMDDEDALLEAEGPSEDDGLADWLCAARESAEVCKQADGRSRAALYKALAMAYDFSVAAKRRPEDYEEILSDAGVKAQERAPMTPVVKLVFGIDYDKTRLTEFAAALSYAHRSDVDFGGFTKFVEESDGGLKGLVAEERKARRGAAPTIDKAALAREKLRGVPAIDLSEISTNDEFALVVTRRTPDGRHEVIARVVDDKLLDRALIKAAR